MVKGLNIAKKLTSIVLEFKGMFIFLTSGWKKILLVIFWMIFKRVCPWKKVKWGMDKVDNIFKISL